jgi:2-keto-4-pentenoate hydratase
MSRNPVSPVPRVTQAARWLCDAHRSSTRFAPLPAELSPTDVADAYDIQGAFVALRARDHGAVAGYKIALTTPAMRAMVGLNESIAGQLLAGTIHKSPATVRAADYVRLIVEFEIAMEMAEDLPVADAPYTRAQVAAAVGAVMPALELADDRDADYKQLSSNGLMLIADNAWNEGAVLGGPVRNWRDIDLAALKGAATINGEPAGEGFGRDVMGHPLDALTWLANNLASRGLGLWRSDVIITGSLVTSKFPKAGDRIRFDAGALGAVELAIS